MIWLGFGVWSLGFYVFARRLMHFVQAKILLPAFFPETKRTHWRLGYFLTLLVGLYFPLNFTRVTAIPDFFLQIVQIFSAI